MSDQPSLLEQLAVATAGRPAVDALGRTSSWQGFGLPELPQELVDILDGIKGLAQGATAILQLIEAILEFIANLSIPLDPVKALLRAAIELVKAALDALTQDAGAYVLLVPARRKVIVSPVIQQALSVTGLTPVQKTKSYDGVVLEAQLTASNPEVAEFFKAPASGGNAGFLRTVTESITDLGDLNRPTFDATAYVGGIHVVAGASDYVNLIALISALDAFFDPKLSQGLAVAGLPVPQNVKGQFVPLIGGTGALLSWDAQPRTVTIPALSSGCFVTQVAIIRSTDPKVIRATTPQSLFGTLQLTKGMKTGDGKTEVVDIVDALPLFPSAPSTYQDFTALTQGTTYYYLAAYNLKMGPLDKFEKADVYYKDIGFHRLSNVCIVTPQAKTAKSGRGKPPDWVRTPSLVDVFAPLGDAIEFLYAILKQFEAGLSANLDALKQYILFIQGEIKKLSAIVDRITAIINLLKSILGQTPEVGVYARSYFGIGGVNFMLADLAKSLAPSNDDPLRPPFDRGDEFVTGVVLLVGGPSEAIVTPLITALNALLGLRGPSVPDALAAAIASVDAVLSAEEDAAYAEDFSVGAPPVEEAALTGDVPLSDEDPGSCAPDTTPAPTFGDDFGVQS